MDETSQKIIDATMSLIRDKGYVATTTKDIAKSAGVNECTLFRKFKTKKDIQNWIETYHVNPKRIGHCYNPIKMIENTTKYKQDSRLIMSIGRISNVKQFHLIPQIASQVFEKHPDWEWHIYGSGDQQTIQVLKDEINNLKRNIKDKDHIYKKCSKCKTTLKLPVPYERGIKHTKCPKCKKRISFLVLKKQKIEIIKNKK